MAFFHSTTEVIWVFHKLNGLFIKYIKIVFSLNKPALVYKRKCLWYKKWVTLTSLQHSVPCWTALVYIDTLCWRIIIKYGKQRNSSHSEAVGWRATFRLSSSVSKLDTAHHSYISVYILASRKQESARYVSNSIKYSVAILF